MKYKLIILDFDGTLADTIPDIRRAVEYSAREFGEYSISDETMRAHITGGAPVLISGIFGDLGIKEYDLQKHIELFAKRYEEYCCVETYLYDGAVELLHTLRDMGCRIAVCTMKSSRFTVQMLETLKVSHLVDAVLCEDMMEKHKPDAWSVHHLCEQFGVTPGEALVVGDGMTDMLMAENAGCGGAAALFGYGDPAKLTEHSNYQINCLNEVLEIVKGTDMEKIVLHGDIDLYNVTELKEQLQNCQAENILIDAADLQYIDSTGLGVLVSSLNKLKEKNGSIRITGLKPHIYKIFALTSLDKIFDIEVAE